jgi:prepilin-type N-terminal cleavage/methylation domain-containing protein
MFDYRTHLAEVTMVSRRSSHGAAGFSLIEIVVALAVGAFLFLLTVPMLHRYTHRANLENTARQTESLMQIARLQAVKQNVNANVVFDFDKNQVYAYVDSNANNVEDPGERELGRIALPQMVYFYAEKDSAPKQANAVDNFGVLTCTPSCPNGGIARFFPDGSAAGTDSTKPGATAVRFGDGHNIHTGDTQGNFIEVRIVTPATGKIELSKWDYKASKYLRKGESGGDNGEGWAWY